VQCFSEHHMEEEDPLHFTLPDAILGSHVLCFSEHHMEEEDPLHFTLPDAILGSVFCRQSLQKGSVCIFVRKKIYFSKIFHVTVKKRIWKLLPLTQRLNHQNEIY
jgi:hypothetical protein